MKLKPSELASKLNITKSAISMALKRGSLVLGDDGLLDMDQEKNQEYETRRFRQRTDGQRTRRYNRIRAEKRQVWAEKQAEAEFRQAISALEPPDHPLPDDFGDYYSLEKTRVGLKASWEFLQNWFPAIANLLVFSGTEEQILEHLQSWYDRGEWLSDRCFRDPEIWKDGPTSYPTPGPDRFLVHDLCEVFSVHLDAYHVFYRGGLAQIAAALAELPEDDRPAECRQLLIEEMAKVPLP